jgi:hypothetical protein
MKTVPRAFLLLAIAVACGILPAALSAEPRPDGVPGWEYRVLTREQVLDLGMKDLAAGLNALGTEGWELAAVDTAYIFKRQRDWGHKRADEIKSQIAVLEFDARMLRDRVDWAERMARKGYLTEQQLRNEQAALTRTETALDRARKALQALPPAPKEPADKDRKPDK